MLLKLNFIYGKIIKFMREKSGKIALNIDSKFYAWVFISSIPVFIFINIWLWGLNIEWIRIAQAWILFFPAIFIVFILSPLALMYQNRERIWNFLLFIYGIASIIAGFGWVIFGIEYLVSFIQRFFPNFLHW